MKIEDKMDEIWQNRNTFEFQQSRKTGDFNMIMITIEDVYYSDLILIETMANFVSTYLKFYQFGMLILAFLIVCFTLCVSICIIRNIVISPIVELTKVI